MKIEEQTVNIKQTQMLYILLQEFSFHIVVSESGKAKLLIFANRCSKKVKLNYIGPDTPNVTEC